MRASWPHTVNYQRTLHLLAVKNKFITAPDAMSITACQLQVNVQQSVLPELVAGLDHCLSTSSINHLLPLSCI